MEETGSLYSQVMEKIKEKIISGEYPVDSKLPNEFKLSAFFHVSRVTLRKAIKGLADDGLLEKIQGVGTFVRKPDQKKRIVILPNAEGRLQIVNKKEYKSSRKLIKVKEVATPTKLAAVLETKKTLYIKRLQLINDDPIMLENIYFPLPKFATLENHDLTVPIHKILKRDHLVKNMSSRDMVISVTLAALNEAKLLQKSVGFPLLLLKAVVENENQKVIYAKKQYVISDRYELHL